jgi:methionyl-tRNA formyltransferase
MRIVVMGQAAFGAKFLETITQREQVIAVYGPPEARPGKPDPIQAAAADRGIAYLSPRSYRGSEVLAEFQGLQPDLLILAFVTAILPADFLNTPKYGSICYHPSILPRHRGGSAINWAVIMGDTKTGLTIFWADGGIDTGPILLQKEVAIGPEDTTGSLYFNHLFPMGIDALMESVALIQLGNAPRIPQDEASATYEPLCDDRVAGIDWSRPGVEVYNLIRGCDPQPGAFATFGNQRVRFYGAKLHRTSPEAPAGTIVRCDQAVALACRDAVVEIAKVKAEGGQKISAGDWTQQQGIKPGERFS